MLEGKDTINGYEVRIAFDGRSCTCNDFKFRRAEKGENCKHLNELERRLAVGKEASKIETE